MISFAIAIGSLFRARLVKMFFSSVSIFITIIGTWWVHINYATTNLELTPIFKYDPAWSLAQVSFTALGVALLIGILGHLVNLAAMDE
jgi:ABC-type transport system involved in cytochrome c biogenesis permease subunit